MGNINIASGILWFVAFLFSTTVHEAMHAFAALRGGDDTAYRGGQVTLNPIPHIRREPLGMLILPLLSAFTQGWAIGWASTPYDPYWAARHPKRAALMSAAGPAGNLLLATVSFILLKAGLLAGVFVSPASVSIEHLVAAADAGTTMDYVGEVLSVFLMLNVILFFFNLIPLPPLDGASALGLVLPGPLADRLRAFGANPMFSLLGLVVAWRIFPIFVHPLFSMILLLLHPDARYGA